MTYRPIPSRPNYFAGDDGSIWSLLKGKARKRKLSPLIIGKKPRLYLSFRINGKPMMLQVSRLILEAFVGPCPEGLECCHNDGDALNNKPGNLRWDTHQSNIDDKIKHGTAGKLMGESGQRSFLTADIAREIVRLKSAGLTGVEISEKLGVHLSRVFAVTNGSAWSHATGVPKRITKCRRRDSPK